MSQKEDIYEKLRKRIVDGEFPEGSSIPSVRKLVADYKSSQGTIGQVLTRMRYEGIIRAEQGRGCFVNKLICAKAPLIRHVIVCERGNKQEDLYYNFTAAFYSEFADRLDIMVSTEEINCNKFSSELLLEKITNMAQQNSLEAIFMDGEYNIFSLEQLKKIKEFTENIYCYFTQKPIHRAANIPSVYVDWYHIGYISVRHLLEIGCRNLLCYIQADGSKQGMYDALEDSTINAKMHVEEYEGSIKPIIPNSETHFDGIFIRNDSNISEILPLLNNHGYNPPYDTAIVSVYDTKWASAFNLTSVNIQQEETVKVLIEMYKGAREKMSLAIKPKLVIRQSTKLFKTKPPHHLRMIQKLGVS